MGYGILADLAALLHLAFILFVAAGAFLVLKWGKVVWLHLPAVVWGALIEFTGWVCPLTPLENRLRLAGGGSGYSGSFIEQYLLPVIYPEGLTRGTQLALGLGVIVINAAVYGWMLKRSREKR